MKLPQALGHTQIRDYRTERRIYFDHISWGNSAVINVKKAKLVGALGVALLLGFSIAAFFVIQHGNNSRINAEEESRIRDLIWKIDYADGLLFHFQMFLDGERVLSGGSFAFFLIHTDSPYHPFYTDVMFVHSQEESYEFPENTIVAWPASEDYITEILIADMHQEINMTDKDLSQRGFSSRSAVTFEEFGLSYPITVADLVDNWEKVAALRVALGLLRAP